MEDVCLLASLGIIYLTKDSKKASRKVPREIGQVHVKLVDIESDPEEAEELQSLDSTAPLSPDHPLTRVSPTPTPTRASFHRRTARMTVHVQPAMSPGHLARVTEAMALLDSGFGKRYRSSYEIPSSSSSPALLVRKRYRGTSELILDTDSKGDKLGDEDTDDDGEDDEGHGSDDEGHDLDDECCSVDSNGLGLEEEEEVVPEGQQQTALVVETATSEPLGLSYRALRHRELVVEEDQVHSTFEVGQGSRSVPEPERPERVSALRKPSLTTWVDPEDDRVYTDILSYPPVAPVQTPLFPKWSSSSLHVSPSSHVVPSPIASPVATPTATISVDEDQFIEVGSGVVRDEIFSQRYRFRSLDREQERTAMPFGALWRPVLALVVWAGHVDTRLAYMSRDRYDDHRLIQDMLVQQAAMQREL
ncbi:hypothetical protein Tco_0265750 [Tanacetum coccineum]